MIKTKNWIFGVVVATFLLLPAVSFAQSEDELLDICGAIAGEDATYLRDFKIRLDAGDPPPVQRYPIVLKKGNKYRFSIASSKDLDGIMKLELYDSNRLMATTSNPATGMDYPSFDWVCSKTGAYHLFYSFKDGDAGQGVGVLSLVEDDY
ncbi:MAG: hypothetical protein CSA97_02405 [Bacteroidetes bacterium]|nr:MAG: hypothetical protein CSA97_02405 [Bacteroidota bacterium]